MAILTDGELHLLLTAIQKRTGIDTRPDQFEAIGRTISRVMREAGIERTDQFLIALEQEPAVFRRLVGAITVSETYFFREPKHFAFIRNQVIPDLRTRFGKQHRFRCWSAACASGEEAYSLAILCQEIDQPYDILATDIAPEAIKDARAGRYRQWSFRGDSMQRVRPHLERNDQNNQWSVSSQIRQHIRFGMLNLATDQYPETRLGTRYLDLILCRNVLIYFNRETTNRIVTQLIKCLSNGGWLITGSADPSLVGMAGLSVVTNDYGTFYRRRDPDPRTEPTTEEINHAGGATVAGRSALQTSKSVQPLGHPAGENQNLQTRDRVDNRLAQSGRALDDSEQDRASNTKQLRRRLSRLKEIDLATAVTEISELAENYPLEILVHYHQARLLLESNQLDGAASAVQKALFLDQSAVMPHFLFGTIDFRRGQWAAAGRRFSTARQLCETLSANEVVSLSDGVTAAELLIVIDSQIAKLRKHSS